MEIIDKYGYLESALEYISKNIVSGRGLQKIAKKAGTGENSLRTLSLALKDFSEKQFFTILNEEIEESHSSLSGASAEITGADISIENDRNKAFVLLGITFDIVIDGEKEDVIKKEVKIFSKNNIYVS